MNGVEDNKLTSLCGGIRSRKERCVVLRRSRDGYGLKLRGQGPIFVEAVEPNSAASRGGLRIGDRILKLNGSSVTELDCDQLLELLAKSGAFVMLTLA